MKAKVFLSVLSVMVIAACGSSAGFGPLEAVPPGVVSSPVLATNYIETVSNTTEVQTNELEPVAVPDQLATDDVSEPRDI